MIYAWLFLHTLLWANPQQQITLQDGSVILGELKGFDGQSYIFLTDTLGEIQLPVEKVRSLNMVDQEQSTTNRTNQPIDNTYQNTDFSVQAPKEARSPKSPREPKEPVLPYYQQGSSSNSNDVNTSLIYGLNNSTNTQSITDMQNMMMSDSQIMGLIVGLQNDPDMSKVLNNPQIMLYMSTGNLQELQKIPELQKVLAKPEMQQLMQLMQQ